MSYFDAPVSCSGIQENRPLDLKDTGIDPAAMDIYIRDRIYSLPGIKNHEETFSILLTGSRATGKHTEQSDIDLDVVCSHSEYKKIHSACLEAGWIQTSKSFFVNDLEKSESFFGNDIGAVHFTLLPREEVTAQLERYDDVPMWIWSNARILADPGGVMKALIDAHRAYPQSVLNQKLKYHYLLEMYWAIEVYPHHHKRNDELLAATTSLINATNEQLRLFYLVEGKPYPYLEALMRHANETRLGQKYSNLLTEVIERVTGARETDRGVWERLDAVFQYMHCADKSDFSKRYFDDLDKAMIDAGMDANWVHTGFDNMDELLLGSLGPMP